MSLSLDLSTSSCVSVGREKTLISLYLSLLCQQTGRKHSLSQELFISSVVPVKQKENAHFSRVRYFLWCAKTYISLKLGISSGVQVGKAKTHISLELILPCARWQGENTQFPRVIYLFWCTTR